MMRTLRSGLLEAECNINGWSRKTSPTSPVTSTKSVSAAFPAMLLNHSRFLSSREVAVDAGNHPRGGRLLGGHTATWPPWGSPQGK